MFLKYPRLWPRTDERIWEPVRVHRCRKERRYKWMERDRQNRQTDNRL